MRRILAAAVTAAFVASMMPIAAEAAPAKSKMGCVIGKEKWDASAGKCMPAKSVKKASKAATKPAPKKAAAKKPVKAAPKKAA